MARVAALALFAAACGSAEARQPLPFDHEAHVVARIPPDRDGDAPRMACVECHAGVETEAWAGMPTVDDCLRCHAFAFTEKAAALEVTKKARDLPADAAPWARLYAIAPHAKVSHAAHFRAKVPCEKCHGGTGKSQVARREMMLGGEALMYWCLECHREKKAATDCLTCHR